MSTISNLFNYITPRRLFGRKSFNVNSLAIDSDDRVSNTRRNYSASVGDGMSNSIVVACIRWITRTFPEAPVFVAEVIESGVLERIPMHELTLLLAKPNAFYSGSQLWKATLSDYNLRGNAYWQIVSSQTGKPLELWWIPQSMIEPKWPSDGSEFISHYEYRPGTEAIRLEVSEVVHFRDGLDPANIRKGLSPMGSLLREIFTDNEAQNFTASILVNMGVPGLVISPKSDDAVVTPASADKVKELFRRSHTGDRRGEPLVMSMPSDVEQFGYSTSELAIRDLRRIPEERISGALGVPAVVAGLGAGLDRSTFSNFAEARESAFENNIIPTQRVFSETLKSQLLPLFPGDTTRIFIGFDLSEVRVLQEDRNKASERIRGDVLVGLMTRNEGRGQLGLEQSDQPGADTLTTEKPVNVLTPREGGAPAFELGASSIRIEPKMLVAKAIDPEGLIPGSVEAARAEVVKAWERRLKIELEELLIFFEKNKASYVFTVKLAPEDVDNYDWNWWRKYRVEVQDELEILFVASAASAAGTTLPGIQPFAAEFASSRGASLLRLDGSASASKTTREIVRKLVAKTVLEGESLGTLQKNLRESVAFAPSRAETVARTETAVALGQGNKAVAELEGRDEKRWETQGDDNVDDNGEGPCADNEAQGWIPANNPFQSGDDTVPNHPNCRCRVTYRTSEAALSARSIDCPGCAKRLPVNGLVGKADIYCRKCNRSYRIDTSV